VSPTAKFHVPTAKRFNPKARGRRAHPGYRTDVPPGHPEGVRQLFGARGHMFVFAESAVGLHPFGVRGHAGTLTRGALRDPGLWG
jgi:hypothetical protein